MEDNLVLWLLQKGGPSIRYRTVKELLGDNSLFDINSLYQDLMKSPQVEKWLCRLSINGVDGCSFNKCHGSRNTQFENVTGKLSELGIKAGIKPLDQRIQPFLDWLYKSSTRSAGIITAFQKSLVSYGLAITGYIDQKILCSIIENRIDELYDFARTKNYKIYLNQNEKEKIPRRYGDKPIVKSEICPLSGIRLPFIYDIYAMAQFQKKTEDIKIKGKINTIIEYILNPAYQNLLFPDYGYFKDPAFKYRYYAIGWSVHLPGYNSFNLSNYEAGYFIQRLELFTHFPEARKHKWFQRSLSHLDSFRTRKGTWIFPRQYLREQKSGYWVTGAYMGLEANRRPKIALELESTFRMLRLLKYAQG